MAHVICVFCCRFLQTILGHISRTFGPLIYFIWEASIIRASQTFTTHCQIKCSYHLSPVNKCLKFLYLIKIKLVYISFMDSTFDHLDYVNDVTPLHYIGASKLIIYVFNQNRYRSWYLQCSRITSHFLYPCFTCFSTIYGIWMQLLLLPGWATT